MKVLGTERSHDDVVAIRSIHRFEQDLARPFDVRRVRVARALTAPEVEDPRGVHAFARGLAPVAGRQRALAVPRPPGDLERAHAIAADGQQRNGRRLDLGPGRQRQLPPRPLEPADPPFSVDRLAQRLVDLANDRRRGVGVVADRRETVQVGRQFRAARVQDVRPSNAQRAAEQARLEHHVVARGGLARVGIGHCSLRRPIVLGKDERGEIDLVGELHEAIERRHAGIEHRRPRLDLGDVLEPPGERLQELLLLGRRTQEDARLHQG